MPRIGKILFDKKKQIFNKNSKFLEAILIKILPEAVVGETLSEIISFPKTQNDKNFESQKFAEK